MKTRTLNWATIVLPGFFWLILVFVRRILLNRPVVWWVEIFTLVVIILGSYFFSTWVFQLIEQREREIRHKTVQLSALNEAALVLTMDLDLWTVLNRVVNLASELVNAKYGALGVLDEDGKTIVQFITSGIDSQERTAIGAPPQGLGL